MATFIGNMAFWFLVAWLLLVMTVLFAFVARTVIGIVQDARAIWIEYLKWRKEK